MAQYLIQDTTLTNMANKIRSISDGSSEQYTATQMVTELGKMESEIDTQTDLIGDLLDAINNLPNAGSNTPEALEVLCDWSTMLDSASALVVIVRNLHPSYYLECSVEVYSDGGYDDTYDFVIEPDEGEISFHSQTPASDTIIRVCDLRWRAS